MASLGNLYPNLPGMLIEFKDGGSSLRFDDTEVNTDSMLILGTAVDGPVMEPVAVTIDTAELLFGSDVNSNNVPNGSTLVHAFKQAYDTGCRDIRLMRISGSPAELDLKSKAETVVTSERIDETDIAVILGNKATTFELAETPVAGSLSVKASAQDLNAAFYEVSGKNLTIKENATDSGALIKVKYKYEKDEAHKDKLTTVAGAGGTGVVAQLPGDAFPTTIAIKDVVANDTVDPAKYEYDASIGKITFKEASDSVTVPVPVNTVIEVTYTLTVQVDKEQNCDDDSKKPFLTESQDQVISLQNVPSDTKPVILYIDNARVLNNSAFTVQNEDKTITLQAGFKTTVKKGQKVSVSYYVEKTQNNVSSTIHLESYFGGDVYNTGRVSVDNIYDLPPGAPERKVIGKAVTIINPDSKKSTADVDKVYSSLDYPTFGLLCDAINSNNVCYKATTLDEDKATDELENGEHGSLVAYFENGSDGIKLSKDELFECLSGTRDENGYITKQGAYQLLENYQVDTVVPVGVYADDELSDKYQNFAYELGLFCAIASYKNKTTLGAIAMKPLRDTTLAGIQKYAKYLTNYKNEYYMKDATGADIVDSNGDKFDLGKYLSVVAGPTVMFNHQVNSLKEANGAVMYMGLNSTLQPQSAATNKKIEGSTGLKYNFSNSQLNDIVGNRFVTFGLKYSRTGQSLKGAYVVDAPTAARPGSEYARLTTSRVIREVADNMREVADPYIGEANTVEQRNSLSAAISKRLDLLVENGVILDYSFNLVATVADQLLGQASLELGIVAPQELRKITTVIGLKRS